jgi:hypothetical protein
MSNLMTPSVYSLLTPVVPTPQAGNSCQLYPPTPILPPPIHPPPILPPPSTPPHFLPYGSIAPLDCILNFQVVFSFFAGVMLLFLYL